MRAVALVALLAGCAASIPDPTFPTDYVPTTDLPSGVALADDPRLLAAVGFAENPDRKDPADVWGDERPLPEEVWMALYVDDDGDGVLLTAARFDGAPVINDPTVCDDGTVILGPNAAVLAEPFEGAARAADALVERILRADGLTEHC